jgi:hypothetical protein
MTPATPVVEMNGRLEGWQCIEPYLIAKFRRKVWEKMEGRMGVAG